MVSTTLHNPRPKTLHQWLDAIGLPPPSNVPDRKLQHDWPNTRQYFQLLLREMQEDHQAGRPVQDMYDVINVLHPATSTSLAMSLYSPKSEELEINELPPEVQQAFVDKGYEGQTITLFHSDLVVARADGLVSSALLNRPPQVITTVMAHEAGHKHIRENHIYLPGEIEELACDMYAGLQTSPERIKRARTDMYHKYKEIRDELFPLLRDMRQAIAESQPEKTASHIALEIDDLLEKGHEVERCEDTGKVAYGSLVADISNESMLTMMAGNREYPPLADMIGSLQKLEYVIEQDPSFATSERSFIEKFTDFQARPSPPNRFR